VHPDGRTGCVAECEKLLLRRVGRGMARIGETDPNTLGRQHTVAGELPLEERPRERLQRQGPAALSTPELIALVCATDRKSVV
jgi:hypothetical protein